MEPNELELEVVPEEHKPMTAEDWNRIIGEALVEATSEPDEPNCEVAQEAPEHVPVGQPAEFLRGFFGGLLYALQVLADNPFARQEGHMIFHLANATAVKYRELVPEVEPKPKAA